MATVIDLRRIDDPRDSIHRTVEALARGCVVGIPTETVYGLAADALNPMAVERLAALKCRQSNTPMALAVRGSQVIEDFAWDWTALARRLARRCMPGPLTLVVSCESEFSVAHRLPDNIKPLIFGPYQAIGFRVVSHPVIAQLHQYLRGPLVLTSANLTGEAPVTSGEDVARQFGEQVPLVLDDGGTRYGGASTVIRVIGQRYEILRTGVIEPEAMNALTKPMIVIVCTGNTCRSPMAEALLRDRLTRAGGGLENVLVLSAGVAAHEGALASAQAVDVMDRRGLDLSAHASRSLSDAILNQADLILTMTRGHRAAIIAAWPELASQVHTLRRDGGDITDPVGAPLEVYEACADQIDRELEMWIEQWRSDFLPIEASGSMRSTSQAEEHPGRGSGPSAEESR